MGAPAASAVPVGSASGAGSSVQIVHTSLAFGPVQALDDVNLTVDAGEFLALLGPSGGGKTTLMRVVAGLIAPDSGRVLIDGRDVTDQPARRRNVNTVFQDYALFPHLSVRDNIAYGPRVHGVAKVERDRLVDELLELVHLDAEASRRPAQLSGGQRQRVALARALANKPGVLLLDEPLAALDRQLRAEVQAQLRRLHEQVGTTFIFITHDQDEAFTLADRVAVLHHGRLIQVGTPDELYDEPATAWVAGFVGRHNLVSGTVVSATPDAVSLRLADAPDAPVVWGHPSGDTPAPGEVVEAMIRPERVAWHPGRQPADAGAMSRVAVTAVRATILGADTLLDLRDERGVAWTVRFARSPHDVPVPPGSVGTLTWQPDDLHLYRLDPAAPAASPSHSSSGESA